MTTREFVVELRAEIASLMTKTVQQNASVVKGFQGLHVNLTAHAMLLITSAATMAPARIRQAGSQPHYVNANQVILGLLARHSVLESWQVHPAVAMDNAPSQLRHQ
jgi:hypothetical protein